jgi:hypothetical protein
LFLPFRSRSRTAIRFVTFLCLPRFSSPTIASNRFKQVITGSCNAVPQGVIAAANKAPSSKFTFPKNLDVRPFLPFLSLS